MSATPHPVERLADIAVYAPIGLAVQVARWVPELAASGREQAEQRIAVARMVGQMAVKMGSKEMKRRFWPESPGGGTDDNGGAPANAAPPPDTVEHADQERIDRYGDVAGVAVRHPSDAAAETGESRTTDVAPAQMATPLAAELPIADYESLAASHVVARLAALDQDELDLVERFEQAHRRRRTVLGKIEQLRR